MSHSTTIHKVCTTHEVPQFRYASTPLLGINIECISIKMASGNQGNVLIIGASRGLGSALAKDYAEQVYYHFQELIHLCIESPQHALTTLLHRAGQ